GGGSSGGGGGGEGEGVLQVQVPQNAADYYAQNLTHFDNLPDAVPDLPDAPATAAPTPARSASDGWVPNPPQARSASDFSTQARSASEGPGSLNVFDDFSASSAKITLTAL